MNSDGKIVPKEENPKNIGRITNHRPLIIKHILSYFPFASHHSNITATMKFESILSIFALIVVAIYAAVRGTNSSSNGRLLHNENGASASSRNQGLANAIIMSSLNKTK